MQLFLEQRRLVTMAERSELDRLHRFPNVGSDLLETACTVPEQSAKYLKLTSESTKRLKDAGDLKPTGTTRISHPMLGKAWRHFHEMAPSRYQDPIDGQQPSYARRNRWTHEPICSASGNTGGSRVFRQDLRALHKSGCRWCLNPPV